jgi:DNA gyrase inhibitor GyrI
LDAALRECEAIAASDGAVRNIKLTASLYALAKYDARGLVEWVLDLPEGALVLQRIHGGSYAVNEKNPTYAMARGGGGGWVVGRVCGPLVLMLGPLGAFACGLAG